MSPSVLFDGSGSPSVSEAIGPGVAPFDWGRLFCVTVRLKTIGVLDWSTTDWVDRAGCVGEDPELFFPVGTTSDLVRVQIEAAKAICARCPARLECLRWALATRQDCGVWGGLSEDERRKLKRRRRREEIGTGL